MCPAEQYAQWLYFLPFTASILAFTSWSLVMSRLTDLCYPMRYRMAALFWCWLILFGAWYELYCPHYFCGSWMAFFAVTVRTLLWLGCAMSGLAYWRLFTRAHLREIARCRMRQRETSRGVVDG